MADLTPTINRNSTNNRNFISSILHKLPYVSANLEMDTNNSKYELFERLSKRTDHYLLKQSIITGQSMEAEYGSGVPGSMSSKNPYHRYIYAQLDTDKIRRLAEYRRMGAFSEVSECLDEICDEFITKDDNGNIVKLLFSNFCDLPSEEKIELQKEFEKFVNVFDLEHKGWNYCRTLLTEGELFFENVIYKERTDFGVGYGAC